VSSAYFSSSALIIIIIISTTPILSSSGIHVGRPNPSIGNTSISLSLAWSTRPRDGGVRLPAGEKRGLESHTFEYFKTSAS
jgi:hypothetical protein